MSSLGIREGMSLEVRNESRNLCCFHLMMGGGDGIFDKGELSLDLVELIGKSLTVVVVVVIALDLCDSIPVIEVRYSLV